MNFLTVAFIFSFVLTIVLTISSTNAQGPNAMCTRQCQYQTDRWCEGIRACHDKTDPCPAACSPDRKWCPDRYACIGNSDNCVADGKCHPNATYRACPATFECWPRGQPCPGFSGPDGQILCVSINQNLRYWERCPDPCPEGQRWCGRAGVCRPNGDDHCPCYSGEEFCQQNGICQRSGSTCPDPNATPRPSECPSQNDRWCETVQACHPKTEICPRPCIEDQKWCESRHECISTSQDCVDPGCSPQKHFCPVTGDCQQNGLSCPTLPCPRDQQLCRTINECVNKNEPCPTEGRCPAGTRWCPEIQICYKNGRPCPPPAYNQQCSFGEKLTNCTGVELSCENPNPDRCDVLQENCAPTGFCVCGPRTVRNKNGKCIPKKGCCDWSVYGLCLLTSAKTGAY